MKQLQPLEAMSGRKNTPWTSASQNVCGKKEHRMALPVNKSRPITIDGVDCRWTIGRESGQLQVIVQGNGSALKIFV